MRPGATGAALLSTEPAALPTRAPPLGLGRHVPQARPPCQGLGRGWGTVGSEVWLSLPLALHRRSPRAPLVKLLEDETGENRLTFEYTSPALFVPTPGPFSMIQRRLAFGGNSEVLYFVPLISETGEGPGMWPPEPPALCPPPRCARVAGDSLTEGVGSAAGAGVQGRPPVRPPTLRAGCSGRWRPGAPPSAPQARGLRQSHPGAFLAPAAAPSWAAWASGGGCVTEPGPTRSHTLSLLLHEATSLLGGWLLTLST